MGELEVPELPDKDEFEEDWMIEAREQIRARYKRKVMAYDEPMIVHHGDCYIFSLSAVCTCGLYHDMQVLNFGMPQELYKGYDEDWGRHARRLHQMEEYKVPPPPTKEEQKEMAEMLKREFGWDLGDDDE